MAIDPTEALWWQEQQASARAMLAVWERARRETLAALQEAGPNDRSLTTIHRRTMLAQTDAIIAGLQADMGIVLFGRVEKGLKAGAKAASNEVAALFGRPDLKVVLSQVNPQLVAYHVERAGELIVAVNNELRSKIKLELANAQAQGLHAREAAKRIASNTDLTLDGLRRPAFKSVEARALVIARTEFGAAANSAFSETLNEAQGLGLNVGKRWSATLDDRTSRRCKSLHDRYRNAPIPLDQAFVAADGWSGMGAPAHPNCRSRVSAGYLD